MSHGALCRIAVVVLLVLVQGAPARSAQALDEATRLAALGRVWGLLKYFSPSVGQGQIDWDEALVRAVPFVKAATTKEALNHEILMLVRRADLRPRVPPGAPIDRPEADPAFAWIDDPRVFDPVTRFVLKTYRHGQPPETNRYVKPTPVGNPDFDSEAPYPTPAYPSEAFRLLALFRYWNMVQYYFPYRDLTDRPWGDVLDEAVPRFVAAGNAVEYHLALARLTASINDAHGVGNSSVLSDYWGINTAPLRARYVESRTVVTKLFPRLTRGADIRVGDVIVEIDGVNAEARRAQLVPYTAGSNPGSLHRNISRLLPRTPRATIRLTLERDGTRHEVTLDTLPVSDAAAEEESTEDKTVARMLPGNVGYVHMGWLTVAEVPGVMAQMHLTRAIIFDVRNYPSGTLFEIAARLNPDARPFVRFTAPNYRAPGTVEWKTNQILAGPVTPNPNHYRGQVIILGDEWTQSHAEYTIMALQTAPDVTLVGSPTAGADGNVSLIRLPGGFWAYITGLGVFYHDGRPTQRIGLVPDHHVTPTIAGIRAGVDEVLQFALSLVR